MSVDRRPLLPGNCSARLLKKVTLATLRISAGLVLIPLLLGACTSMSAEECSVLDWRSVGYEDGVAGLPGSHIGQYRKACAKHGVGTDLSGYQAGREMGLREYCQPANGFRVGERGESYQGVCPTDLEQAFLGSYDSGHKLYTLERRAENATQQLAYKREELSRLEQEIVSSGAVLVAAALARHVSGTASSTVDLGCGTGLCAPFLRPLSTRLAGVDLSDNMLAQARAAGLYDELACADIGDYLAAHPQAFDLAVAADVLVYFGELDTLFGQVRAALRSGGTFCFSTEALDQGEFMLLPSNRYAHALAYLERLAARHGFTVLEADNATVRSEQGAELKGHLLVLRVA